MSVVKDIPENAGQDCIDTRLAYCFSDLEEGGAVSNSLPKIIDVHHAKHQRQGAQKETKMACTIYGLVHARNNQDKKESLDALAITIKDILPKFPTVELHGWSMQGALQTFLNLKYISGYAVATNDIEVIARKMREGRAGYCGSTKIDFLATYKNNNRAVFVEKGPGHVRCFDQINFDTKEVRVHDSSRDTMRDKGHFYIKFDDFIKYCYTKVFILTPNESQLLKELNDKKFIQKAIDNNITNGDHPLFNATRGEVAVMIARAYTRETLNYQEGIEKAKEIKAFNGQRENDVCTRGECMLMVATMLGVRNLQSDTLSYQALEKLGVTGGLRKENSITREEATIMISRAFTIKHNI